MATNYIAPTWRMPENSNQSKLINYSLGFDTSSQSINIGSNFPYPSVTTDPYSIAFWIKPKQTTAAGYIFSTYDVNSLKGIFLSLRSVGTGASDKLRFQTFTRSGNSNYSSVVTSNPIIVDEWHHVVVTFNGAYNATLRGFTIYINGSPVSIYRVGSVSANGSLINSSDKYIGQRADNTNYLTDCDLTEFSFFDYEISQDQVTYLYNLNNPMAITGAKPIVYYPLGDNSNPRSVAGYPNLSVVGSVFNFDGTSDFIDTNSTFNTLTSFTVSAWFKLDAVGTTVESIVSTRINDISTSKGFDIFINANGLTGRVYDNGATEVVQPFTDTTSWHNVVLTYNGTTLELFLDNSSIGTATGNYDNSGRNLTIGKWGPVSAASYYFDGLISNVSIFNTSLSTANIETIYNNGAPNDISSLSPTAWYKLDSSEIFNSTSTEWSVDNNAYPSVYKSSLNFNGSSNYIDCGSASYLNGLSQFSVSCWFNLNTAASNKTIVSDWFYNSGVKGHFALQTTSAVGSDYSLLFLVKKTNDVGQNYVTTGRILTQNTWNHAVFAYNSGTVTCYINGQGPVSLSTTGTLPTTLTSQNGNLNIGKFGGSLTRLWDGEISQVSIFNTELTSSEVTTIYNNGTPEASISHSPVSWYKLDNTTTGIQDSAGSNNGTNNGATEYAGFVNSLAGESSGMDSSNLVQSDLYRTTPYSNYSINFDSPSGDYFNFNNASSNIMANKNTISISAWFKLDSNTSSTIASNWYGSGLAQYLLRYNAGSGLGLQWYIRSNANVYRIDTNYFPSVGDWVHIVGVKDPTTNGGQIRVYVNTVEYTQDNTNFSVAIANNNNSDQIGVFNNASDFMNGSISNVAYWTNTALTQGEVTEIYNAGVTTNLSNFSGTAPDHWCTLDGKKVYYNGSVIVARDAIGTLQATGVNLVQENILGNAPGSNNNGTGSNLDISDLKGDMSNSTKNAKSINMADYGDPNGQGVTPADSGRTTSVPG